MSSRFRFPHVQMPPEATALRKEVREFLAEEIANGGFVPMADCWASAMSAEFSRKVGQRGWLGMTWDKKYGGHGRTFLERYVVTEEMLAAGAPVMAHWVADRQSGPQLIKNAKPEIRDAIIPRIVSGDCFCAIGMSEPNTGSDLASVATKAEKVEGGWKVNGTKLWSTGAHGCDYMITLLRTSPLDTSARHQGLSQFIIDLKAPGVDIRGIADIGGQVHFNETNFEDVFVPDDYVLGEVGGGWNMVVGELALERSGPERFLSTFIVLQEAMRLLVNNPTEQTKEVLGQVVAKIKTLRRMSLGIAGLLQEGASPEMEAALVKDMSTNFERELLEKLRKVLPQNILATSEGLLPGLLRDGILRVPSSTLRGGTNEVLKGMIARQLGMR
ncbi:MAG: acyl-CoA dehydrogenase family protein [Porticoccaceae bacterium]|nr:acyl-CoA dehydrogenase family protein [Porticoccaceae bacterium]